MADMRSLRYVTAGGYNTFIRNPSGWIDVRYVGTSNEAHTVPTGAKICIFSANKDFYVRADATAAIPSDDVTDGSGSEINPTSMDVSEVTALNIIGSAADTIITMSFYGGDA